MKKAILAASIAMFAPANADISGYSSEIGKTRQNIIEALSNDNELTQEELQHQAHIQKLIPEIQEPIILGDLTQPGVSITIDDGYGKESIEYVLNLFEKQGVRATFFVI